MSEKDRSIKAGGNVDLVGKKVVVVEVGSDHLGKVGRVLAKTKVVGEDAYIIEGISNSLFTEGAVEVVPEELSEHTVKVNVDAEDFVKGMKAIQRLARETTKDFRAMEEAARDLGEHTTTSSRIVGERLARLGYLELKDRSHRDSNKEWAIQAGLLNLDSLEGVPEKRIRRFQYSWEEPGDLENSDVVPIVRAVCTWFGFGYAFSSIADDKIADVYVVVD